MRMRWLGRSFPARSSRRGRPVQLVLEGLELRLALSALTPRAAAHGASAGVIEHAFFSIIPGTADRGSRPDGVAPDGWGSASISGNTPAEIAKAYEANAITFGSVVGDGAGQTIAIVDAYDDPDLVDTSAPGYSSSELAEFDQAFGLPDPPSFMKVNENGSAAALPGVDPAGAGNPTGNWEVEEALDVEWAHALAPAASIVLVECSSDSGASMYQGVVTAAALPDVSVVSMSWGSSEFAAETTYDGDFTTPAGHEGVTFVAATGDDGSPGDYPAYSPNVVAAGGTSLHLSADGTYQSESAWSDSGGGISTREPEPAYQEGVQQTRARTIPDMAFDADPDTGVAVYDSYNNPSSKPWEEIGGTSLAAPSLAALIAIADQGRVLAGQTTLDGATQTLPALYSLPATDWNAVTGGSNGAFHAGPSYNEVTGRGTPKANLLVPDLAAYGMAAKLVLTFEPSNTIAGTPLTLSVEAENAGGALATGFDGSVTVALQDNTAGGALGGTVTVLAQNGVATFTDLTLDHAGSGYTLTVTAGGTVHVTTGSFSVAPAAPARVAVFTEPPAGMLVNAAFGIGAAVVDQYGNVVPSYTGVLTAVLEKDPRGGLLAGTLTVTVTQGYAEFSDLSVIKACSGRFIKISGSGLAAGKTTAFDVTNGEHARVDSSARLPHLRSAVEVTARHRRPRRRG
jgi:hypothetical protein